MKPWKLQKFGSDLVYDLRSRGLLPLVLLLVVGIVAAPLVISKMGDSGGTAAPTGASAAVTVKTPPETRAAVVSYSSPGLRKYRERLSGDQSKNPFTAQYTDSGKSGAGDTSGGGATTSGSTTATGDSGGTGSIKLTETQHTTLYYFYYETDVRSGEAGTSLKRQNKISPFTILPDEAAPVAVFLGVAKGGKQAIFSVSRQVTGVAGDGVCYPDPQNCELLGLGPNAGADLSFSTDGKIYRIEVARIKFRKSTKPPPS